MLRRLVVARDLVHLRCKRSALVRSFLLATGNEWSDSCGGRERQPLFFGELAGSGGET
jgi:hypothetical protein